MAFHELYAHGSHFMGSAAAELARVREEQAKTIHRAMVVAEVGASSFGFAWLAGRYPDMSVVGIQPSLLAGVALVGLGMLEMGGGYEDHLVNLGAGAIATYFATLGASLGHDMKTQADQGTAPAPAPIMPAPAPKTAGLLHEGYTVRPGDAGVFQRRAA